MIPTFVLKRSASVVRKTWAETYKLLLAEI